MDDSSGAAWVSRIGMCTLPRLQISDIDLVPFGSEPARETPNQLHHSALRDFFELPVEIVFNKLNFPQILILFFSQTSI